MARLGLILGLSLWYRSSNSDSLVRDAAHAASTSAVLMCGFPFSAGARFFLPALSLFPGASPVHETEVRHRRKLFHVRSALGKNRGGGLRANPGNRLEQLMGRGHEARI
jgi:hypothetical protein